MVVSLHGVRPAQQAALLELQQRSTGQVAQLQAQVKAANDEADKVCGKPERVGGPCLDNVTRR